MSTAHPRNHVVANPEGLSASVVLEAFADWVNARIGEAMRIEMDLAFRDRPFDIEVGREPALVGWEHKFIQPGAAAPGWMNLCSQPTRAGSRPTSMSNGRSRKARSISIRMASPIRAFTQSANASRTTDADKPSGLATTWLRGWAVLMRRTLRPEVSRKR